MNHKSLYTTNIPYQLSSQVEEVAKSSYNQTTHANSFNVQLRTTAPITFMEKIYIYVYVQNTRTRCLAHRIKKSKKIKVSLSNNINHGDHLDKVTRSLIISWKLVVRCNSSSSFQLSSSLSSIVRVRSKS